MSILPLAIPMLQMNDGKRVEGLADLVRDGWRQTHYE